MNPSDEHASSILAFVSQFQSAHGHAPTYRAIGRAVGIRSTSHVSHDLKKLVRSGALVLLSNTAAHDDESPGRRMPARRYRCGRCHIRIPTATGMCADCAEQKPFITYAGDMGADRFYQTR